ncbi:glycosyltransferase family 2 protein [Chloroflexota bacterium]
MDKPSLVSIITPTYQHDRFIGECIESVLAQTYPHWEQLIIDDGSNDNTAEIVSRYKDERIKYVKQKNAGIWKLGKTYNKALSMSQGDLIAVLEGDDFWPPDKLEKQVPVFKRPDIMLCWGRAAYVNSSSDIICVSHKNLDWFKKATREKVLLKLLLRNFIPSSTVICRKDALLSVGGFCQPEYATYVDHTTWLQIGLIGDIFAVDEIVGYWRRYRNQVTMRYIAEIAEAHTRYATAFFNKLPLAMKILLDITADELLKQCQYITGLSYLELGKVRLSEGQWSESRKYFIHSLGKGNFSVKIVAMIGIACSYLRLDIDWFAFIMRRQRFNKFL